MSKIHGKSSKLSHLHAKIIVHNNTQNTVIEYASEVHRRSLKLIELCICLRGMSWTPPIGPSRIYFTYYLKLFLFFPTRVLPQFLHIKIFQKKVNPSAGTTFPPLHLRAGGAPPLTPGRTRRRRTRLPGAAPPLHPEQARRRRRPLGTAPPPMLGMPRRCTVASAWMRRIRAAAGVCMRRRRHRCLYQAPEVLGSPPCFSPTAAVPSRRRPLSRWREQGGGGAPQRPLPLCGAPVAARDGKGPAMARAGMCLPRRARGRPSHGEPGDG
jgi:hypothetical protein